MLLIYLQGYTSRRSFLLTINGKILCSKNGKKFTTEERCHYRQSIACLILSRTGKFCVPACGMFQVAGSTEACDALRLISQGSIDVFSSRHHRSLAVLQENAPLLASFLSACRKGPGGVIPDDVLSVVDHILLTVRAPFTRPAPPAQSYPPPNPSSPLSFFPHLP